MPYKNLYTMSSDILACLELDKDIVSSKVIVAKEINGCDSCFISSCILGHCVKNRKAVLVILTHNSFMHYQNIGLKMNYNLQKSVESGLIQFYNIGNEVLTANKEISSLAKILSDVEEKITSMKKEYGSVNIIFEGVSHLFDLQFTLKEVNNALKAIISKVRQFDNSFLLCHCNVANENDVTHVLANLLCHKANTIVEVERLSSGWSADVSGHMTVKHPSQKFDQFMFALEQKSYQYLFKLFDRGVKLFAPGTV